MSKSFIYVFVITLCAVMLFSCGNNTNKETTEKIDAQEVVEKLIETGAFGEWSDDAADAALEALGLGLKEIRPDFEILEADSIKTNHGTVYRGTNEAVSVFIKKDMSPATTDDLQTYVRKLYGLTQKIADDGRVIYGFEMKDNAEEANAEWTLDEILAQKGLFGFPKEDYAWAYKKDGQIKRVDVKLLNANQNFPERLQVEFHNALQKSFNETMEEAEKALDQLDEEDFKKAIKEATK